VGALAIVVIDAVLIDRLHGRLGALADPAGPTIAVTLDDSGKPLRLVKRASATRHGDPSASARP
jgi:hypothetical protein